MRFQFNKTTSLSFGASLMAIATVGIMPSAASAQSNPDAECLLTEDQVTVVAAGAQATGDDALACGGDAIANGTGATATGSGATATGAGASSYGNQANANGTSTTAVGALSVANGTGPARLRLAVQCYRRARSRNRPYRQRTG